MSDSHDCLHNDTRHDRRKTAALSSACERAAEPQPVYSYPNAASCPDCGAGMVRLGSCFACPLCGFGACG